MESVFNKVQHRCFPVKFATFLRATTLKNICERMLLYFHYYSHHHYHYYHFHYHRKMHFYRLRMLLTIPLVCNMISSLAPSFLLFTPSKMTQNSFTTTRQILDVLVIFIFIFIVIYIYLSNFLHLLACTYLHFLTYLCSLYTII